MAIPGSGSVSLSSIQTEWGGSNPASMSEYYSGNIASNTSAVTTATSVSYSSTSQYVPGSPGGKYTPATPGYTAYYRQFGHKHTQLASGSTMEPAIGATNTIYTYTFVSGIDQVGNAGQIPSSGAIQMNHFRGTANSPSNTSRGMAGFWFRQSIGSSGGWSNHQVYVVIQGTFGTNYQAGNTWNTSSCPYRYIDVPAKDGVPATRLYGSDAHQNSGWVTGKNYLIHYTYPSPVGAATSFIYTTNNNTNINMSGTWNITMQT